MEGAIKDVKRLAAQYRRALEGAKKERVLCEDIVLRSFPKGCCGDACILLSWFLLLEDVELINT